MLSAKNIYGVANSMGKIKYFIAENKDDALTQAHEFSHIYDPANGKATLIVSPKDEEHLGPDAAALAERGIRGQLIEYDITHDKWILRAGDKKNYRHIVLVNGQEKRCTGIEDARMLIDLMPTKAELDSVTDVTTSRELGYGQTVRVLKADGVLEAGIYLAPHPSEPDVHLIMRDDESTFRAVEEDIEVVVSVDELALNVIRHARVNCPLGSDLDRAILDELQKHGLLVGDEEL